MYKFGGILTDILNINPAKGGFSIYPNPSNGQFKLAVVGCENQNVKVNVYNSIGSIVYSSNESSNLISYNMNLDLTQLAKGVYVAEILSGKTTKQQKIVIE